MIFQIHLNGAQGVLEFSLKEHITYASIMNQVNISELGEKTIDTLGRTVLQVQDIREVEIPLTDRIVFHQIYNAFYQNIDDIYNIVLISHITNDPLFDMRALGYALEVVRLYDRGIVGEVLEDGSVKTSIMLQIALMPAQLKSDNEVKTESMFEEPMVDPNENYTVEEPMDIPEVDEEFTIEDEPMVEEGE